MKPVTIEKLSQILKARITEASAEPSTTISGASIDSRTIKPGECFFAIPGENFDGHDFIGEAIKNGAVCIVSQKPFKQGAGVSERSAVLVVESTITSLGRLAAWYRKQLSAKVIAITGSTGKTTTRQIIYHCLKEHFNTFTAPRNFNNAFGLPLAILTAQPEHEIVVLELATNSPGEIGQLSQIANPDIALITNIYPTHLEGLGSIEGIIKEKCSIYKGLKPNGRVLINADFPELVDYCRSLPCRIITFGTTAHCQIKAFNLISRGLEGTLNIDEREIFVPLPGPANLQNTLAAWAVCKFIGVKLDDFADAVGKTCSPDMRLQIEKTSHLTIINDSYNANPASMKNSLDCLAQICSEEANRRVVFICGPMAELGAQSEKYHKILGKDIACARIHLLLAVGPFAETIAKTALANAQNDLMALVFDNTEKLCDNLQDLIHKDDIILVKGSRRAKLEKAVEKLRLIPE